eukprot:TRINITY_DN5137_c0_g1_i4.p1 TRINITY_DN5137_c0_g1~~TRINITY_DN5137_c0_g1_i4.p1  ORF type:complete len:162 (-),score=28.30 TRINITY_DN5137_c0_g1_i4:254-697(-)
MAPPYDSIPGFILPTPDSEDDPHLMVTAPFIGGSFVMKLIEGEKNGEDMVMIPMVAHLQAGGSRGDGKDLRLALSKADVGMKGVEESRFDVVYGDQVEYQSQPADTTHNIVLGVYRQGSWEFWSQSCTKESDESYKVQKVNLLYRKK